jgi:hypothetical protein
MLEEENVFGVTADTSGELIICIFGSPTLDDSGT